MKSATRKYVRILEAQTKVIKQLSKLSLAGDNWQKERDKAEKLEKRHKELTDKLIILEPQITQQEFEEHLEAMMCCSWEDFKG